MRIFVTGAFGNVGRHAVRALVERGHEVRALKFSRASKMSLARVFGAAAEHVRVVEGDVRDRAAMDEAVRGADVVVHLAYVIPPPALEDPALAESVNLGGTRALLDAARAAERPPKFLFASTLDVYGLTQHLPPPRRVGDPLAATDAYSAQKISCEQWVRDSGLTFAIFRFADVPPLVVRGPHPMMFRLPLDTRIEAIHPDDAARAIATAVERDETWGRAWNIGGGKTCQLTYREYLTGFLSAMGLGPLPDDAFSREPYCTDWLDTDDSQRAFDYQRKSFADIVRDVSAVYGWRRHAAKIFSPLVRRFILRLSPHRRAV